MKQPYVSTLIEQDFTSAEKALGRHNIDAISSADLEGYATQEWVQDQNYITSADLPDTSDMATKTWTSENFYPDTNPSGFITSSDVPRYREGDYISIDPVTLAISVTGVNPDDYATHEEVESATSGKMDASEASAFYPRYENPEGYITSGDLPDFHVYSAGQYVNIDGDTINVTGVYPDTNPSGFATSSWVVEQNYITSADIPPVTEYSAGQYVSIVDHVVSVTGLQPEGDYLTRNEASAFITSADLPDLSDYATKTYVDENFYSASNPSGFITSADLPDLTEYATTEYVDNSIYSATSGKQDKLDFGYTDNKISSINSSAIYSTGGGSGSEVYRKPYGGSETFVSALKIDSDDPDGYAYVKADDVGQGYLVSGPYKTLLDAGINSGHGVGDSATPIYIDIDGTFKTVSATFTQEQADWAENDNTQVDYIKNKPTGIGLKAGYGITLTDETSAVLISSNVQYPTVEARALKVSDAGQVNVIYPQSSACIELHVITPKAYEGSETYSARINNEYTYVLSSGCWYDFCKTEDAPGTEYWYFKASGSIW